MPAIARQITQLGARASVAINPETPPDRVLAAAGHFDMILVMSVHPGFGGQGFIAESVDKLRSVREEFNRRGLMIDLQVDGGIKMDNIGRRWPRPAQTSSSRVLASSAIVTTTAMIDRMRHEIARPLAQATTPELASAIAALARVSLARRCYKTRSTRNPRRCDDFR